MVVIGATISPLEFTKALKKSNIKYSVNEVVQPVCLFLGLDKFIKHKSKAKKKKCVLFDSIEKLEQVQGLVIIKDKNPDNVLKKLKEVRSTSITGIAGNYIKDIIGFLNKNKDNDQGFLHLFSTNLYKITNKPTREITRALFLSLVTGTISRAKFDKEMSRIVPKKGKALTSFESIIDLTKTVAFANMQECMQKAVKAKSDKEIVQLAKTYDVSAFDVRYFLSYINKT